MWEIRHPPPKLSLHNNPVNMSAVTSNRLGYESFTGINTHYHLNAPWYIKKGVRNIQGILRAKNGVRKGRGGGGEGIEASPVRLFMVPAGYAYFPFYPVPCLRFVSSRFLSRVWVRTGDSIRKRLDIKTHKSSALKFALSVFWLVSIILATY